MCDNSSRPNLDDDALWYELLQREKTLRDWESEIIVARDKGREEGRQEGIEEGIVKLARNMLAMNVPMETIQECTGLPMSKIRSLA